MHNMVKHLELLTSTARSHIWLVVLMTFLISACNNEDKDLNQSHYDGSRVYWFVGNPESWRKSTFDSSLWVAVRGIREVPGQNPTEEIFYQPRSRLSDDETYLDTLVVFTEFLEYSWTTPKIDPSWFIEFRWDSASSTPFRPIVMFGFTQKSWASECPFDGECLLCSGTSCRILNKSRLSKNPRFDGFPIAGRDLIHRNFYALMISPVP